MRYAKIFILVLLFISASLVKSAQKDDNYQRFYYSCKIWGFYKYFHTEVAKGPTVVNWDNALLDHLDQIITGLTDEEYNQSLLEMLNKAGNMAEPVVQLPVLPDSLKPNLDLGWISDSFINPDLQLKLNEVKDKFRPQNNYYVVNSENGNPLLDTDDSYSSSTNLPNQKLRLLALFRYWNIINYFFPYKNIMDQNWDSTLVELIPSFINSSTADNYGKSVLKLAAHLNDTHGVAGGFIINNLFGNYYLPFVIKTVENKTIITHKLQESLSVEPGDVILEIDNRPVETIRDSLRQFCAASNNSVLNRVINEYLLRGDNGNRIIKIEDSNGIQKTINCYGIYCVDYYNLLDSLNTTKWSIINSDGKAFGYVNLGKLLMNDVHQMFTELWNTDALIFDVRDFPNSTILTLVNYLFTENIIPASYTNPNENYPGTVSWIYNTLSVVPTDLGLYNKNIALLFDEQTQSEAEYTVMALEQHQDAVKIGSQTAGADGNYSTMYLPGGLRAVFSALGWFYPDGTQTQRIGIIPEIEVHPTIAGIRAGRDELLEVALQNVGISTEKKPDEIELYQNYPNPFNNSTVISYLLNKENNVKLSIYNAKGEFVHSLVNGMQTAGKHSVSFNADKLNSGVYFYKLESEGRSVVNKMLLVK